MKYDTDLEGLQQSVQQIKSYIDNMNQLESRLSKAAQNLGSAKHFPNLGEAASVAQAFLQQVGQLQDFSDKLKYWGDSLQDALIKQYVPTAGSDFSESAEFGT